MKEYWELIDKNKNKTGILFMRDREDRIPEGMYHLSAETWCLSPSGKLLLARRQKNIPFGGLWEASGGSVKFGESGREGAARELREELGIIASPEGLIHLSDSVHSDCIMESYLLILTEESPKLSLQEEEVASVMWLSLEEILEMGADIVPRTFTRLLKIRKTIEKYIKAAQC